MNATTPRSTSAANAAAASAMTATIATVPATLRWLGALMVGCTFTEPSGRVGATVGSVRRGVDVEPMEVDVEALGTDWTFRGPPVPRPSVGSLKAGVGSNGIQPAPVIHTSGHAWALRFVTWKMPSDPNAPGWYPTATRAGTPTERAIAANDAAKCS